MVYSEILISIRLDFSSSLKGEASWERVSHIIVKWTEHNALASSCRVLYIFFTYSLNVNYLQRLK